MNADIENNSDIPNIYRIRSIKNNRPTTTINTRFSKNKEFVNILKKGNLDLEKLKILDQTKKSSRIKDNSANYKSSLFPTVENEIVSGEKDFSGDFYDKSDIEKYLNDENFKTEYLNKQKQKLRNIDLIEKNYQELYGWKSLFSKSKPLSCYTQVNEYKIIKNITKKNEENKNFENQEKFTDKFYSKEFENEDKSITYLAKIKKKRKHPFRNDPKDNNNEKLEFSSIEKKLKKEKSDFIFPIALIDETEDKLYEFITIPKNVSQRRKKMENFLHLASKSKNKNQKLKNKNNSLNKTNKKNNHINTFSLNDSQINSGGVKDEFVQASLSRNFSNKINKTITKINHNSSRISQSVIMKKRNKLEKNSAIRPMSVYSQRSDSAVFYMCKEFSDYFKQDLKEFSENFSLLHPKIKCDNSKIKKLLEEIKLIQDEDEKIIKNFKIDDNAFDIKDLNLAGNSKNIFPLLKTFLKNYYTEEEVNKFFKYKTYPISNRPLGNKLISINNKENPRGKILKDLHSISSNKGKGLKLEINTYEENDPDLKIFSKNLEDFHSRDSIHEASIVQSSTLKDQDKQNIEDLTYLNSNFKIDTIISSPTNAPVRVENINVIGKDTGTNVNLSIEIPKETKRIDDFDTIVPKSEVFREKKIKSRPRTAMNKKDFVNQKLPELVSERIAETEENSEISLDRRISNTKNFKLDLPVNSADKNNSSPYKNLTFKGVSNHPYSYKMMNLNMKNQINSQHEPTNILKDALHVKNVHNQIIRISTNVNAKTVAMFENLGEIKQRKRPTTSKWSSNLSNLSNRLSNQFNSTFMKGENEKSKGKINSKVNNLYFNNYIDMQFKSNNFYKNTNLRMISNASNREESSYYITATKNDKFSNELILSQEKKNANEKSKNRCQSAVNRKVLSHTANNFYNPILNANSINKDIINMNNLNMQTTSKKVV